MAVEPSEPVARAHPNDRGFWSSAPSASSGFGVGGLTAYAMTLGALVAWNAVMVSLR